jgi:hypothetical protein
MEFYELLKRVCELYNISLEDLDEISYGVYTKDDYAGELADIRYVTGYGGKGKGEEYWFVLYHTELKQYLKIEGYYQSYNGVEFPTFEKAVTVVKPIEKLVTYYE